MREKKLSSPNKFPQHSQCHSKASHRCPSRNLISSTDFPQLNQSTVPLRSQARWSPPNSQLGALSNLIRMLECDKKKERLEWVSRGSNDLRGNRVSNHTNIKTLSAHIPWMAAPLAPPLLPFPPFLTPPCSTLRIFLERVSFYKVAPLLPSGEPSEGSKREGRRWIGKMKETYFRILRLRRHPLHPAWGQGQRTGRGWG